MLKGGMIDLYEQFIARGIPWFSVRDGEQVVVWYAYHVNIFEKNSRRK